MRYIKYIWLVVLLVCICSEIGDAQVPRKVLGVGVEEGVVTPPTGACLGSFTMSNIGVLDFTEQSANGVLGLGVFENSFNGFGYLGVLSTAATSYNIYRINLITFLSDLTIVVDVANSPDSASSHDSSYYDTGSSRYVNVGRQITGACLATQDCLHIREYNVGTLTIDTIVAGITFGTPTGVLTFDATDYYIVYGSPGATLGKVSTSNIFVASTAIAAIPAALTTDNTYLYGTVGTTTIRRWLKSSIGTAPTDFTPGFLGGSALTGIIYDSGNNSLYVASPSAGLGPNYIHKVDASTMTLTGSVALGNTDFVKNISIDSVNDKLYVGYALVGTTGGVARLNRTAFTSSATFGTVSTANGPVRFVLDVPHQDFYIAFAGGGGDVVKVQKINLCQ